MVLCPQMSNQTPKLEAKKGVSLSLFFGQAVKWGETNPTIPGGLRPQTSLLSLGHGRAQISHRTVTNSGREGLRRAGDVSPPCLNPKDTRASLEQQAGKVLTGKGWEISTWDLLMLFTHLLPSVSLCGALGQIMVPVKWVTPSSQVGKGHLHILSTDSGCHCPLQPPPATSVSDLGSLALHPSTIPIEEMLALTF